MPLPLASPMSTPIGTLRSAVLVPSLAPCNVTMIFCALVTAVRLTVIVAVSLPLLLLTASRTRSNRRVGEGHHVWKVKDNLIIIARSAAATFDARITRERQIDVETSRSSMGFSGHDLRRVWAVTTMKRIPHRFGDAF